MAVQGLNSEHTAAEHYGLEAGKKPAENNGRSWILDDLPRRTSPERIFLYEYDTIQAFQMKSNFISEAYSLLDSIRSVRHEDPNRVLIFIAHGLGGLLVLQVSLGPW